MATLTETAYYTRRIIKIGIFFTIFLIVLRIAWVGGMGVYRNFFPEPPPPPTVEFGRLPALPFPEKQTQKYSYSLQTPTGELPKFADTQAVYFMPQAASTFGDLDQATATARRLGFTGDVQALSDTVYRFAHLNAPATVDMNIVNKTFSLSYNLTQNPEFLTLRPRSVEEATSAVRSFLSGAGLLAPDLAAGEAKVDFIKAQPPNLVPAISLSESNFLRVNLFRESYGELPVLTPDRSRSNVWFLVSGSSSQEKQIIAGEYHYFAVDQEASTYPVKTAQEAWDELVEGAAFISQEAPGSQVTIRRVYLAYYDSGKVQQFLQPIVVFEGDGGFRAYVPAITADYYGSQE